MWETWVRFLGWEDPLEKNPHSSIVAWRIPWTMPKGSQRIWHDWVTVTFTNQGKAHARGISSASTVEATERMSENMLPAFLILDSKAFSLCKLFQWNYNIPTEMCPNHNLKDFHGVNTHITNILIRTPGVRCAPFQSLSPIKTLNIFFCEALTQLYFSHFYW